MNRMYLGLLGAVLLSSAVSGAEAADLTAPQPYVPYAPPVAEPAAASGWYLRGDIGVGINGLDRFSEAWIDNGDATHTTSWLKKSVGDSTVLDVGVGYQFNDYLRGDVTVQYRTGAHFLSIDNTVDRTGGATNGNTIQNVINGDVSSTVLMGNVYWDITHWNGLTPFVGAGLGAAYNRTSGVSDVTTGTYSGMVGLFADQGKWNLAYALHAGVAWDVNSRLKLEAAYSFQSLGDAKLLETTCIPSSSCTSGPEQYSIKKLYSNDFRIGARWLFDAPAAPSFASYPVVAKN